MDLSKTTKRKIPSVINEAVEKLKEKLTEIKLTSNYLEETIFKQTGVILEVNGAKVFLSNEIAEGIMANPNSDLVVDEFIKSIEGSTIVE